MHNMLITNGVEYSKLFPKFKIDKRISDTILVFSTEEHKEVWDLLINKTKGKVEYKILMGTINPPYSDYSVARFSHIVNKFWVDDNELKIKIKIYPATNGNILKKMLDNQIPMTLKFDYQGNYIDTDSTLVDINTLKVITLDFYKPNYKKFYKPSFI